MPKLGVNIDHVATLRQARGGRIPSPALAARQAQAGGADGITLHLREDRRHIQDWDLPQVKRVLHVPLNLEMALHPEILRIALRLRPEKVCVVPEKRKELTTEGGLDVLLHEAALRKAIPPLRRRKIQVSLFIDPSPEQIEAAARLGADAVEIHTGRYAHAQGARKQRELKRIREAARLASAIGLKVHAGHGLEDDNVGPIARISEIEELNIGHSIVSRAVFVGLRQAVREMKQKIRAACRLVPVRSR